MTNDANNLRQDFLRFFESKGLCRPLPSSSLQPPDASTLFTSAGMHQFKPDFMGNLQHQWPDGKPVTRAATVQKCMRTPDLENVGRTARHHTFFEMLGFFSFGDFFKREAIQWIWEFYTSKDWCGLDVSKLHISVYRGDEDGNGRDEEAADIWREVLSKHWDKDEIERRISWLGEHDNFWPAGAPSQGPNGVCGPCSEIFYDLGDEYGQGTVESNGDRFMEIGNIVFTQFERSGPAPGKGVLTPLPAKNIDFGGGFERLVMVKEGVKTTLDTSLFMPVRVQLRSLAADTAGSGMALRYLDQMRTYRAHIVGGLSSVVFGTEVLGQIDMGVSFQDEIREKRIADHIRAITFAMSDGILPSNEGAGYVIRRILRRAFRDGSALGFDGPFLHKLVPVIVEHYGDAYPELRRNTNAVVKTIEQEEQQFNTTLERGLQQLATLIRDVKKKGESILKGKPAFDLYQSQGLPREVVQDELAAEELTLDQVGYDEAEEKHREASKGGKQTVVFEKGWFQDVKAKHAATVFTGYDTCVEQAKVVAMARDGELFDIIEAGDSATIVLDRTPFYGESGGQVGDRGSLQVQDDPRTRGTEQGLFEVADTQKRDDFHLHEGKLVHGKLRVGDVVTARVDAARRDKIRANHSATHLMHAALRTVLGDHVVQRGSEVGPDRLRFDFSHPKGVTFEERQQIERLVNEQIQANAEVGTAVMTPEAAQQAGAMALFGEKYGDKVRVLTMGKGRDIGVPPMSPPGVPPGETDEARGEIKRRKGAYLPHWEAKNASYFVTFRLADSLPAAQREQIVAEREHIVAKANQMGRELSDVEKDKLLALHTDTIDQLLAAGHGACPFKDDDCAVIVANALKHFDGVRYHLYAWCVMPNHVHVVFRPIGEHGLEDTLHSWKSFTAKECNKALGRSGEFWLSESFDRLIRNSKEFERFVRYTLENPAAAGLKNWKWVGEGVSAGETPAGHTDGTSVPRAFSMELCGGTHVGRTGDIGYFRIVSEGSSAAGIRRIEAVTGQDAYALAAEDAKLIAQLHGLTKAQPGKVLEKVEGLLKEVKDLKGKAKKGGGADAGQLESIKKSAQSVGEFTVYTGTLDGAEAPELLTIRDALVQDGRPSAVLLGSRAEDRALLLVSFTKEMTARGLHAGKIVGEMAPLVGGRGGGKPEVAQAGGKNPDGLHEALNTGLKRIREALEQA